VLNVFANWLVTTEANLDTENYFYETDFLTFKLSEVPAGVPVVHLSYWNLAINSKTLTESVIKADCNETTKIQSFFDTMRNTTRTTAQNTSISDCGGYDWFWSSLTRELIVQPTGTSASATARRLTNSMSSNKSMSTSRALGVAGEFCTEPGITRRMPIDACAMKLPYWITGFAGFRYGELYQPPAGVGGLGNAQTFSRAFGAATVVAYNNSGATAGTFLLPILWFLGWIAFSRWDEVDKNQIYEDKQSGRSFKHAMGESGKQRSLAGSATEHIWTAFAPATSAIREPDKGGCERGGNAHAKLKTEVTASTVSNAHCSLPMAAAASPRIPSLDAYSMHTGISVAPSSPRHMRTREQNVHADETAAFLEMFGAKASLLHEGSSLARLKALVFREHFISNMWSFASLALPRHIRYLAMWSHLLTIFFVNCALVVVTASLGRDCTVLVSENACLAATQEAQTPGNQEGLAGYSLSQQFSFLQECSWQAERSDCIRAELPGSPIFVLSFALTALFFSTAINSFLWHFLWAGICPKQPRLEEIGWTSKYWLDIRKKDRDNEEEIFMGEMEAAGVLNVVNSPRMKALAAQSAQQHSYEDDQADLTAHDLAHENDRYWSQTVELFDRDISSETSQLIRDALVFLKMLTSLGNSYNVQRRQEQLLYYEKQLQHQQQQQQEQQLVQWKGDPSSEAGASSSSRSGSGLQFSSERAQVVYAHSLAAAAALNQTRLERKAVLHIMKMQADGSPRPLKYKESLRFQNRRAVIEHKIRGACVESMTILEQLHEFGHMEDDCKDVLMVQHFVLANFNPFQRVVLRKELFQFDNAGSGRISPIVWAAAWLIVGMVCFLMLLFIGITMVMADVPEGLVSSWMMLCFVAIFLETIVLIPMRMAVLHVMLMKTITPQLRQIYRTLSIVATRVPSCGAEGDNSGGGGGGGGGGSSGSGSGSSGDAPQDSKALNINQHTIGACRAARLKGASHLSSAHLLANFTDVDLMSCKVAEKVPLNPLVMLILALPAFFGLWSDKLALYCVDIVNCTMWACCIILLCLVLATSVPVFLALILALVAYVAYLYLWKKPQGRARRRMGTSGSKSWWRRTHAQTFDLDGQPKPVLRYLSPVYVVSRVGTAVQKAARRSMQAMSIGASGHLGSSFETLRVQAPPRTAQNWRNMNRPLMQQGRVARRLSPGWELRSSTLRAGFLTDYSEWSWGGFSGAGMSPRPSTATGRTKRTDKDSKTASIRTKSTVNLDESTSACSSIPPAIALDLTVQAGAAAAGGRREEQEKEEKEDRVREKGNQERGQGELAVNTATSLGGPQEERSVESDQNTAAAAAAAAAATASGDDCFMRYELGCYPPALLRLQPPIDVTHQVLQWGSDMAQRLWAPRREPHRRLKHLHKAAGHDTCIDTHKDSDSRTNKASAGAGASAYTQSLSHSNDSLHSYNVDSRHPHLQSSLSFALRQAVAAFPKNKQQIKDLYSHGYEPQDVDELWFHSHVSALEARYKLNMQVR
jgi:hypothetical protein